MKLRRPAIELVLMIQASLFISGYTFGLCVISASELSNCGYWMACCFTISSLCLLIDYTRVKFAVGTCLIFVGSFFLFSPVTYLTGIVIGVTGFALTSDSTMNILDQVSRNTFEHWKELWSMQCAGLGLGLVWGWISFNKLS